MFEFPKTLTCMIMDPETLLSFNLSGDIFGFSSVSSQHYPAVLSLISNTFSSSLRVTYIRRL